MEHSETSTGTGTQPTKSGKDKKAGTELGEYRANLDNAVMITRFMRESLTKLIVEVLMKEFSATQVELADRFGKAHSQVSRAMRTMLAWGIVERLDTNDQAKPYILAPGFKRFKEIIDQYNEII